MDREVSDGVLIDIRSVDMATLLNGPTESSVRTALDRLLVPDADRCNDFSSNI